MTNRSDEKLQRLRVEIREKRRDVDETVVKLKEAVSVERLVVLVFLLLEDAIMEKTRQMAKETGHAAKNAGEKIYDVLSDNLFPTAMAGVGLAWMISSIVSRSHQPEPENQSRIRRAGQKISETAETARDTARKAFDRAGEEAEAIARKAEDLRERAGYDVRRVGEKSKMIIEKNPLYTAGVLFTVGVLIGFAVPRMRNHSPNHEPEDN